MSADSEFVRLIDRLYSAQRVMAALQKHPCTYAGVSLFANESHTLRTIALNEGISQMELSDQMLRTKGATSAAVDKLVDKGLVRRRRVEGDQRRYLLTLTELGRQVDQAHMQYDQDHARMVLQTLALPCSDLEAANRVLERLLEYYPGTFLCAADDAAGPKEP